MSRTLARTALATAAGLAFLAPVAPAGAAPAQTPERSASAASSAASSPKHVVRFTVKSCEGCRVRLSRADADYDDLWQSRSNQVTDGVVRFAVPSYYADGLTASIIAPWEGRTGYVTQVVFRYTGEKTGSGISVAEATSHQRGTLCLRGDEDVRRVTVPLTVRKVAVPGVDGPTTGTLAFATRTQRPIKPVSRLTDGVGGSQDVPSCH